MQLVLDPGVLVAAVITPRGVCAQLLERWLDEEYVLIVSPALLNELEVVLLRARFRRYLSEEDARRFVHLLAATAELRTDPPPQPGLTPDQDDDYLVALARITNADALVSGDQDLTTLPDPVPPVLSPRATLDRLDRARELQATSDGELANEGPPSAPWIRWLNEELLPDEAWPSITPKEPARPPTTTTTTVPPFAAGVARASGTAGATSPMPIAAAGAARSSGTASVTGGSTRRRA